MPAFKVEIQEVIERSGIVSAASEAEVGEMLERRGYALFNEDVQVVQREVGPVVEVTPAVAGVDNSFMLDTEDGLGAIPVGATLLWNGTFRKLEQLGTHYFPGGTSVFDRVHPMTVALAEESRRRLMGFGHKGGWRLDGVGGRTIWLSPDEDTLAELEGKFGYPDGSLRGGD